MPSPDVEFSTELIDGTQLGKLVVPWSKTAEWINFLIRPKQDAVIVSAEQGDGSLVLYFQAPERLYAYLDGRVNSQIGSIHPETIMVGKGLSRRVSAR